MTKFQETILGHRVDYKLTLRPQNSGWPFPVFKGTIWKFAVEGLEVDEWFHDILCETLAQARNDARNAIYFKKLGRLFSDQNSEPDGD